MEIAVENVPSMENSQLESSAHEKFGERLRLERKKLALTQKGLAELGGVGLGAQHRYEAGSAWPDADYLLRIGAAGVDWQWVMTGGRSAARLNSDQTFLVDAYGDLAPLDQMTLLQLAASLARRPAPPRPKLSERALTEALVHFLRVSPTEEVDALARELATSMPTILQAASIDYQRLMSGEFDKAPAMPAADDADRREGRQALRN